MLKIDGRRAGRHPGKMPGGIKLADCTYELMGIFEQMTISDKDRASRAFKGMTALAAGLDFYDIADREPYVVRWYLQDAAKNAMIHALSAGRLPVWTDYDGQFVELDPEAMFAPNKWVATHTVQTGTYVALNVAHGRDGPTRSDCDGATLWVRNDDWQRVNRTLLAQRETRSGGVFPPDMAQLLNEAQSVAISAPSSLEYDVAIGVPKWTLYEAVAWLGSQDIALVEHQHPRYFPATIEKNYGAVAWRRLVQSLSDRSANGGTSVTADVARHRLIAACESGLVQATGIPSDQSDRRAISPNDFSGAKLWEGRGGSLHRSIAGGVEAPRWFDLRFDASSVRDLAIEKARTSDPEAPDPVEVSKKPPVSARDLREWVRDRNKKGWSQDRITKEVAAAFPHNEVPGRPTLRKLDADVRTKLKLPARVPGRNKKGE
jgi:hypothetical protein